ncbi:MAG TPA: hypothetical protein VIU64_15345 [Polyangia bacterium]
MTSRGYDLWRKAAALAPALLLLAYLPAQAMLRCRIDGLLRTACCCPHPKEEQPSGPAIRAQDCCDREIAQNQRPKADLARSSSRDLAPERVELVLFALAAPLASPPVAHRDRAAQRHGPAREGPPIVLLKHAFLI